MPPKDASPKPDKQLTPTLKTESEHLAPVLGFFALHRMATPNNVMEAFPQWFSQHQCVIRHLNWMHNIGYLRRHGDDRTGYTFNITNVGYERCRDNDIDVPLTAIPYKYTEPTGKQALHELLITKCATSLLRCVREEPDFKVLEIGRFGLQAIVVRDPETGEELRPFEHLIPDLCYLGRDRNGMMFRMWEVIRGVESVDNLREMVEKYEQWEQTKAAQIFLTNLYRRHGAKQRQVVEFQVHCVLESSSWKHTDEWKERLLLMQTFHAKPRTQVRFWTVTKEELDKAFAEKLTVNAEIWHRASDLIDKRERFRQARDGTRTRLVDGFMRTLDTYPLFA